ncbi:MAG: hypothetical protein MJ184_11015 [Treponema sp.]|uniref:hypothetical protein n=1 Tax=Treponema sp. TaxID=166 RepID=UPI00298D8007|nr:hypothetical protein [Treponema sp.]MCQ2601878.1 hypothetical protein [Treponema sp.]
MTLAFEKYSTTINDGLSLIQAKFDQQEKVFYDKCDVFDSKLAEFIAEKDAVNAMKDQLQKMIEDFRSQINKESEKEKQKITNDCTNVLEACNQRMGEIKTDVITFLKNCQEQNLDIIEKIPEQKRKFSWKDVMIYAVCGTSLVCNVIQIFMG